METLSQPPERITVKQSYRDILRLFLPCLAELFLAQLVSMIDMIMVGGLGTRAINAVGICGNPMMLLIMIFTALNVGTTSLVSRAKGEGNIHKVNEIVRHALLISGLLGVVMTVLGFVFTDALIAMMGTPNPDTAALASDYLRCRMIGILPTAIGSAVTAALRGMGNARTPMIYNLLANLVNVLFNWLLIHGVGVFPEMGVTGAALATSISNFAGTFIALGLILRGISDIKLSIREKFVLDRAVLSNMIKIGLPSMAEQVVFRIGMILFGRLTISLGEVDYAAHQLCWNILNLLLLIGSAIQMSTAPLTGQSLGRNDPKRAETYNKHAFWLLFGLMVICGLACNLLGEALMMLYSPELEVLAAGMPVLRLFGAYLPILAFQYTYNGALQGAGDTKFNAAIFMITTLGIRIPVALVFKDVLGWGLIGVNLATAVDQLVRSSLFYVRYKTGKWKTVKLK